MHGCGNDYLYVVADRIRPANPAALARRLSDRHFGVGADGLIMLVPSRAADLRMEMYNADGSRGAMCGNGIRCLARLAYEDGLVRKNPLVVETDTGLKVVALRFADGHVNAATVDMGEPEFEGTAIPVRTEGPVIDYPLEVGGANYRVTVVSMGNPHCVVFVDDETIFGAEDATFARLGGTFEHHPFFASRVNTEFVRVLAADRLRMRVWERGSGETFACGTGACAALAAAAHTGRANRRAIVEVRGGELDVEWREGGADAGHIFMTGEAVEVFRGRIELDAADLAAAGEPGGGPQ